MFKRITAILLVCIMSTTICFASGNKYFDQRPISIQVNGEMVTFDVAPKSYEDVTYAETDKLAAALNIDVSELESKEIDGVKMSPVRLSADKKGYSTYWAEWQKTVIIIDTDGILSDVKTSTKNFCDLFKQSIKIPENGEFVISSKLNYKVDGGQNGFNMFAGADLKGSIKMEKDKIYGDLTLDASGLYKLYSMVANSFTGQPDGPINFKFYIDDSGIYYKSAFANKMMFEGYDLSEEFKNRKLDSWIKVGFDEIGIEDFKSVNSIRNYDVDYALNQYLNIAIFDNMEPKKQKYMSTYDYNDIKWKSETLKKYLNDKYLTVKDNKFTFNFTEKDIKWFFEEYKKGVEDNKYMGEKEKESTLVLVERFIDSIKGEYKSEVSFKNNCIDKSTSNLNLEMTIPFYYNQQICTISANCIGTSGFVNLGKTVIANKAPIEYLTNKQLQDMEKFDLESYENQDNEI